MQVTPSMKRARQPHTHRAMGSATQQIHVKAQLPILDKLVKHWQQYPPPPGEKYVNAQNGSISDGIGARRRWSNVISIDSDWWNMNRFSHKRLTAMLTCFIHKYVFTVS